MRDEGIGVRGGDFGNGEEFVLVESVTGARGEGGRSVAVDGEGDAVSGEGGREEVEWGRGDAGGVDSGGGGDGEGEGGRGNGGIQVVVGGHFVEVVMDTLISAVVIGGMDLLLQLHVTMAGVKCLVSIKR